MSVEELKEGELEVFELLLLLVMEKDPLELA
jgi:hypothetical protein